MRRGEEHGVTARAQDRNCSIANGAGKLHSSRLPMALAAATPGQACPSFMHFCPGGRPSPSCILGKPQCLGITLPPISPIRGLSRRLELVYLCTRSTYLMG